MASSTPATERTTSGLGRVVRGLISLLVLLALWAGLALWAQDDILLPSPIAVAQAFRGEVASGEMAHHMGATLLRVLAAFLLAMGIGGVLGIVAGRNPRFNDWMDPWLIVLLNLPALVVIVLAYLWIGLNETGAIAAVALNKIPMIAVMMRDGARTLDPALDDLARAFSIPPVRRWRHVIAPQLAPHFASAGRAGFALIWKIVLVVEFLGRPDGVGFQIYLYFQLFDVAHVLAYALAFVAVMLAVEYLIVQPWEKSASRWRRDAA